jgi:hypothetical protein
MIGCCTRITGRLVVASRSSSPPWLALLASYVGRAERASVLAALDEDLRGVTALLALNIPPAPSRRRTSPASTPGPTGTAARSAGA